MKIICFDGNYHTLSEHRIEKYEPVLFLKPETSLLKDKNPFFIPDHSKNISPRINIILKICRLGKNIQEKFAHKYYDEISVGVDLEATDTLKRCRDNQLPWEVAKAFEFSAPVGRFISKTEFLNLNNISFSIKKNGECLSFGNTSDMVFNFDKLVAHASKYMMLKMGDFIFTGSPAIQSTLQIDDKIECYLEERKLLSFHIK